MATIRWPLDTFVLYCIVPPAPPLDTFVLYCTSCCYFTYYYHYCTSCASLSKPWIMLSGGVVPFSFGPFWVYFGFILNLILWHFVLCYFAFSYFLLWHLVFNCAQTVEKHYPRTIKYNSLIVMYLLSQWLLNWINLLHGYCIVLSAGCYWLLHSVWYLLDHQNIVFAKCPWFANNLILYFCAGIDPNFRRSGGVCQYPKSVLRPFSIGANQNFRPFSVGANLIGMFYILYSVLLYVCSRNLYSLMISFLNHSY